METLERVKLFLGIEGNEQDKLITEIINVTESQLKMLLDSETLPEGIDFVVHEMVIKRYNRLGSEGMDSESVEGHTVNYSMNEFKPYQDYLETFMPEDGVTQGEVLFY